MAVEVAHKCWGGDPPLRWEASGSLVGIIPERTMGPSSQPPMTMQQHSRDGRLGRGHCDLNVGFSNENKLQHNILKTIELNPQQTAVESHAA